ncbi:unnamed protein product [Closterium sp. NIES-54]
MPGIHGSKDSIKIKIKDSYTSPRQLSPAGDLRGLRELLAPSVRQAAKAALGGVGTPTLLSRAVASAENVGAGTKTPTALTLRVPLTELLRGEDVARTLLLLLLLLALTASSAAPLRSSTPTTSTSAAPASAPTAPTSASAAATSATATTTATTASTAATSTPTPATTSTATPTPSAASTSTSTTPTGPTRSLAPLALARAASPARGRRRTDRLRTSEVGRSGRGDGGQERGRRTPLKNGGAGVTSRGSYSDYALLCRKEGLLEAVDCEGGGTDREEVVPDYTKGVREASD